MPKYDYTCHHCGTTIEVMHRVNESYSNPCIECNNPYLKKKISKTSFTLKGDCWARDGYTSK